MDEVCWHYRVQWLNHSSAHSVAGPTQGLIASTSIRGRTMTFNVHTFIDSLNVHLAAMKKLGIKGQICSSTMKRNTIKQCEKEHNKTM